MSRVHQTSSNRGVNGGRGAVVRFGRFRVLLRQRQLIADGLPIELGTRAFDLLLTSKRKAARLGPNLFKPSGFLANYSSKRMISAALATTISRGYCGRDTLCNCGRSVETERTLSATSRRD